jgi:nucleotide-binding universal stress UspA family protein
MHKLLVPLDGSPASDRALNHAIMLAGIMAPMHVHVVSVHEMPHDYGRSAAYFTAEELAELEERHSREILQPAAERLSAAGVSHSIESAAGNVAEAIVASAAQHGCDTIVMGTRGLGSVASLVLGSVATTVVQLAGVPVLLVK